MLVTFASGEGRTYRVFGGTDLSDTTEWPEVSSGVIEGTGSEVTHSFVPDGSPQKFFFHIRED